MVKLGMVTGFVWNGYKIEGEWMMRRMNRRDWCLGTMATGMAVAAGRSVFANEESDHGVGTGKGFKGPVGLQLYSLRDTFAKDVEKGFEIAMGYGFKEVELANFYGMEPDAFRKKLDECGFTARSIHWDVNDILNDPKKVIDTAQTIGLEFIGCAWAPHSDPFDEKQCLETADRFNRAGEALAKGGIQFFYHNHGFEFQPYGDGTLFDLLVAKTDPALVAFEMDVFWTVHPGQDPVSLLKKYPDRWQLFHLKDLAKGVETGKLTGSEDVRNDVALGTGQIDLKNVLRTAQEIGVKYYYIEDESPSVIEQIPRSLKFLESL